MDALIGRDFDLKHLKQYLLNGNNCQLVGPAGIGKTTLLQHVTAHAREWSPAFRVAYLDLSKPACQTAEGFWTTAWAAWNPEQPPPPTNKDIIEWVEKTACGRSVRLVLCLDNFEEMMARPREFGTFFLLDLRSLSHVGLTMVTASRKSLGQIVPPHGPTSPFFNIFAIHYVGPLSRDDSEDFLTEHTFNSVHFDPKEKEAVLGLAKGFPQALELTTAHAIAAKQHGQNVEAALREISDEVRQFVPV